MARIISGCVCEDASGRDSHSNATLSQEDHPAPVPKVSKHHPPSWGFKETKKVEGGWILSLSLSLSWDLLLILLSFLGLQILKLVLSSPPTPHLHFSSLQIWAELYSWLPWFSSSQTADRWISQPHNCRSHSYIKSLTHTHMYPIASVSLENSNTSIILLFSEHWI